MDHLNSNITLLQKHHPHAYAAMHTFYAANQANPVVAELQPFAGSHEMNLTYSLNGESKRTLYAQEPSKYWDDCIKHAKNLDQCRILFVFGIGLGDHLKRLIEENQNHIDHFVIVEIQPVIAAHAFKLHDFKSVLTSPKVTVFVAPTKANSIRNLKAFFLDRNRLLQCQKLGFYYHLPSLTHDGAAYVEFTKAIDNTLSNLQEIFRAPAEDNVAALYNLVANCKTHAKTPYLLASKDSLKNRPALIIGAGPALDNLLPTLKSIHNKFHIFAVDAAIPTLLKHDIIPDFIVCAERTSIQAAFFKDLPPNLSSILITLPTVHPNVLAQFANYVSFAPRLGTYGAWLNANFSEDLGLGVSTLAFQATQILGCAPVFLVGQNFAYARTSNQAYTATEHDYVSNIKKFLLTENTLEVPGNNGKSIKTDKNWNLFRNELASHILLSGCDVYNVIDANEGAKIEHCKLLNPTDFATEANALASKSKWLSQSESTLGDSTTLLNSTSDYLSKLHTACLNAMQTLHNDFFQNINSEINPDIFVTTKDEWIKRWTQIQEDLIDVDRDKFYFFTNLTFVAQNLTLLMDRENLDRNQLSPYNYMFKFCFKTIDWIQALDAWTIRLQDILTNSKPNSTSVR